MKYADVILPLPLENSYTYRIPEDLERAVTPGCRVIVHFGKKRYYTAIVMEVHDREPVSDFETKEIYALLDATPVLRRPQLRFWKWISSYYICKLGDVYKAALPSGLKLESETAVYQLAHRKRRGEVVAGVRWRTGERSARLGGIADHQHPRCRADPAQLAQRTLAVQGLEIQDDEIVAVRQGIAQTRGAVAFRTEAVTASCERASHGPRQVKFVFDYEDAHGKTTESLHSGTLETAVRAVRFF
mgnify:CR=1 FL=1